MQFLNKEFHKDLEGAYVLLSSGKKKEFELIKEKREDEYNLVIKIILIKLEELKKEIKEYKESFGE